MKHHLNWKFPKNVLSEELFFYGCVRESTKSSPEGAINASTVPPVPSLLQLPKAASKAPHSGCSQGTEKSRRWAQPCNHMHHFCSSGFKNSNNVFVLLCFTTEVYLQIFFNYVSFQNIKSSIYSGWSQRVVLQNINSRFRQDF